MTKADEIILKFNIVQIARFEAYLIAKLKQGKPLMLQVTLTYAYVI